MISIKQNHDVGLETPLEKKKTSGTAFNKQLDALCRKMNNWQNKSMLLFHTKVWKMRVFKIHSWILPGFIQVQI